MGMSMLTSKLQTMIAKMTKPMTNSELAVVHSQIQYYTVMMLLVVTYASKIIYKSFTGSKESEYFDRKGFWISYLTLLFVPVVKEITFYEHIIRWAKITLLRKTDVPIPQVMPHSLYFNAYKCGVYCIMLTPVYPNAAFVCLVAMSLLYVIQKFKYVSMDSYKINFKMDGSLALNLIGRIREPLIPFWVNFFLS